MLDIKLNTKLVNIYFDMLVTENWSSETIKNKLAYLKRKGYYEKYLALQCASKKFNVCNFKEQTLKQNLTESIDIEILNSRVD